MSDNSIFDPDMLLNEQFAEANSTTRMPVPEGEYVGMVKDIKVRVVNSKDGTRSFPVVDITWDLDDQNLREAMDRKEVTCRQGIMLDVTANGGLDMSKGKNVSLGRLREALNMNTPGQSFSFAMLPGAGPATVSVKHRHADNDPEIVYDEVKAVAKIQ